MSVLTWIETELSKQVGQILSWTAVCFGLGIAIYFALRFEPDLWGLGIGAGGLSLITFFLFRLKAPSRFIAYFPTVILLGGFAAGLSAHLHSAPRLNLHYYGPIYGRVVTIDRSGSHAVRLTLDQVVLARIEPKKTPTRIRISMHGEQDWLGPMPGQYIGTTGHLSAPNGPTEPGGFDFQRHAWFLQLGAVGYTRVPVLEMNPPEGAMYIGRMRRTISQYVSTYLGGDIGGFAAAVTTGDRSAFSTEAMQALRVSNLAHLLAISGLHMGLLAGFLFAAIRYALALWPPWALRWPVKKIAALTALSGATCYLILSGASIATQRAYIMAAVALIAVSLDRRALTLRAVAIAALMVMAQKPSSLLSAGFHMSFAATTALVWVFGLMRNGPDVGLKSWQRTVFGLFVSSAVAGLATAPFAAAHFNQWAAYGLLANITAVPAMGIIVIPGAVLAALLHPIGLDWVGFEIMGLGLRWILAIAHWVSAMDGARVAIVSPHWAVLPILSLAACWMILWQGRLRWLGVLTIALSLFIWTQSDRPEVLISGDGKLIGVMGDDGRILSKANGQGFVAKSWLENDGDAADQFEAAGRKQSDIFGVFRSSINAKTFVHLQGKRGVKAFTGCHEKEIIISDQVIEKPVDCQVIDARFLKNSGAIAIRVTKTGALRVQTVTQRRGQRLWSPPTPLP
ncbi:MAG: ComEC family competence protein [Cognatishimia sp.]|uniref:ComEC/Rec2 family competence protein n=1 Tax=Cognatishimia sp. TaxID=2211648 RepID=UPI003B8C91A4